MRQFGRVSASFDHCNIIRSTYIGCMRDLAFPTRVFALRVSRRVSFAAASMQLCTASTERFFFFSLIEVHVHHGLRFVLMVQVQIHHRLLLFFLSILFSSFHTVLLRVQRLSGCKFVLHQAVPRRRVGAHGSLHQAILSRSLPLESPTCGRLHSCKSRLAW